MRSRREFLQAAFRATGVGALAPRWIFAAENAPAPDATLVVLIQRGAMDGLSLLVPFGDPDYRRRRPQIALHPEHGLHKLDATFGLHPAAGGLHRLWEEGSLAFVTQTGSPDGTRSHFDAQDYLETGTPGDKNTIDGFLNRALQTLPTRAGNLRAVALQPSMPRVLQGKFDAVSIGNLKDFSIQSPLEKKTAMGDEFEQMYQAATDRALRETAIAAFRSLHSIESITAGSDYKEWVKRFPKSNLGKRLAEIAWLIHKGVGLQIAVTDMGGWDTHAGQGAEKGQFADRTRELSEALFAFAEALRDHWSRICLVTVTEFGRTVAENGTRGTDHGHGSVMMAIGGRVQGRRVLGAWRGLGDDQLFEGRDVPVTTDFRRVFADVLHHHLGVRDLAHVFPRWDAHASSPLGLWRPT